MRYLYCVAGAALLAFGLSAKADTSVTYNITGTLADGSFSGFVVYDQTTEAFTGGEITDTEGATTNNFDTFTGSGVYASGTFAFLDSTGGSYFALGIPTVDLLADSTSGNICSSANACDPFVSGDGGTGDDALTGTYSISTTPEPSALALLGTGILGVGGVIRRRRM